MFEALSKGFREARNRLSGLTELNEKNVATALREVRLSLLDADVELGVVKRFLADVEKKALGAIVQTRVKHGGQLHAVSAGDQFIKICHDELVELMKPPPEPLAFRVRGVSSIMMVGLQGSGKTTTAAKLAQWLLREGRKPLLVAADMQRPAAVEQLVILGGRIDVPVFNLAGKSPLEICAAAPAEAERLRRDVIVYDTAGRLSIDEALMKELGDIKSAVHPDNILLVLDAMIGQDAVRTAKNFNERLKITGVVLTKLDGDARGGAALSVKEVTGAPVTFIGIGEGLDKLETFRAEGLASRVLGMGDVVGLMQDFETVVDQKKAEEDAMRMLKGDFSLDDFLNQIRMIQKMGSLKELVDKIPGMGGMLPPGAAAELDDRELVRIEAMIQSLTREERRDPHALIRDPSRVQRVARGSGQPEAAVGETIQKFLFMKQMMSGFGQSSGLLDRIPGMGGLNMARNLRRAMKSGKLPGGMNMPGMPGMGMQGMGMQGMPGMGMQGMGMQGADGPPRMRVLSKGERNQKKSQRKRERDARKQGKAKR